MRLKVVFVTIAAALLVPLLHSAEGKEGSNEELFRAIRKSDIATVRQLLEKGADVNARGDDESTPLMHAALYATPECVKLLLEKGADPDAKNAAGATALMWGISDIRKVRLLVENGAGVNARSGYGKTPLLLAASYDGGAGTVKFLLNKSADPAAKDKTGATTVILAAESGNVAALELLIKKGVDVNAKTGPGFNEFQFGTVTAVRQEMQELRAEANVGFTALMVAAEGENIEAVKLLLAKGADVNAKTGGGVTALHLAANNGNLEIVQLLLDRGASVNDKDPEGNTPLMVSAASGSLNAGIVRALIDKGADVNFKGLDDRTAIYWAKKKGDTEIVKILRQAGAAE